MEADDLLGIEKMAGGAASVFCQDIGGAVTVRLVGPLMMQVVNFSISFNAIHTLNSLCHKCGTAETYGKVPVYLQI